MSKIVDPPHDPFDMRSTPQQRLDYLWGAYHRLVQNLAKELFTSDILPFFKRKGIKMVVKQGVNMLYIKRGNAWAELDPGSLPKAIRDLLDMPVPGMGDGGTTMGEFMPDFTPDEKD